VKKTELAIGNARVAEFYEQGKSVPQIACILGVKQRALYSRMKRWGIATRSHSEASKLSDVDKQRIIELYEQGLGYGKAADLLGISRTGVYRYLRKKGQLRDRSQARKLIDWHKEKSPCWKGGRRLNKQGYLVVYRPEYPRAGKRGEVLEHILVWEVAHRKPLPENWAIHHLNGIKNDNRLINLVALPNTKHSLILAEKAKRIKTLEVENVRLCKALEEKQAIFYVSEVIR